MNVFFYIVPLIAFLSVVLLIPLAIRWAYCWGFLDMPSADGERKQHDEAVPPIGGIVIFPVFLVALYVSGFNLLNHWAIWIALILVVITGALDDRFHINTYIKLVIQVIASLLIIWPGGAMIDQLGNMFGWGEVNLGIFAPIFSFAAVLLLINAMNLSDGLDGLCGGIAFVILGWLFFAALIGERESILRIIIMLMAVLAGFLIYNFQHPLRRKASVFIGDSGSMALGVMIAFLAISLGKDTVSTEGVPQIFSPISVAWVIAIPIMDACAQFIRRMAQRKHPFDADRGHFHHLFVDWGVSVRLSVWIIVTLCVMFGMFGASVYFFGVPQFILTFSWVFVFCGYVTLLIYSKRLGLL